MPGQHITDEQRRKFMKHINEEKLSVEAAAAKSGFSRMTGFRIKKESRAPEKEKKLRGRRIRAWRAENGPDKEVTFRQNKKAGHQGISDFTDMKEVEVTIGRRQFDHKLYHFCLPWWSGFVHASIVEGGESFAAFSGGPEAALRTLGGALAENRTDRLSAAFRNLTKDQAKDMTARYEGFCATPDYFSEKRNRAELPWCFFQVNHRPKNPFPPVLRICAVKYKRIGQGFCERAKNFREDTEIIYITTQILLCSHPAPEAK